MSKRSKFSQPPLPVSDTDEDDFGLTPEEWSEFVEEDPSLFDESVAFLQAMNEQTAQALTLTRLVLEHTNSQARTEADIFALFERAAQQVLSTSPLKPFFEWQAQSRPSVESEKPEEHDKGRR